MEIPNCMNIAKFLGSCLAPLIFTTAIAVTRWSFVDLWLPTEEQKSVNNQVINARLSFMYLQRFSMCINLVDVVWWFDQVRWRETLKKQCWSNACWRVLIRCAEIITRCLGPPQPIAHQRCRMTAGARSTSIFLTRLSHSVCYTCARSAHSSTQMLLNF